MKNLTRFRHLVVVCLLAAAALAVSANDAQASHFRYGTITWTVPNPAQPNVVNIRFDSVWRWSFPYDQTGAQLNHCPPGFVTIPAGSTTGSGACPAVGTTILGLGTMDILLGTTTSVVTSVTLVPVVTSVNSAEDWFSATFQANGVVLPVGNALYTARFTSNARLSTLLDGNANLSFTVTSGITIRVPPASINQPPTIGTLPIIVLARGQTTSFQLAASDPNGDPLTFRIATTLESSLVEVAPPGLSLSPAGVVTWTPATNGLYAMQARVSDPLGAFTVADFLMQVKDAVGLPPVVNINGLAAPQTATTVRNVPFSFTVSATDPENKPVMLSAASLPSGSTMTPSLPLTALNPSSTFHWTPPANGLGTYVMSFAGLDGDGRQDSNTMVLTVTNNAPTIACTAAGPLIEATGPTGGPFSISANVNDADADKVTVAFFVDGVQRQISGLLTPPATQTYAAPFALGHHTYEGRVGDGLSNVSCLGAFDVVDTTAPSILVTPGDQTITAVSPAGAPATFTVSAHDDVDPAPVVSCSQASGSVFAIGPTVVTCTATDASHNHNDTSFTITVTDTTSPVVTPTVTGTLGNNGWYTSDVSVTWTTVDVDSGIASSSGCENQLVNADIAGVTFTCTATNGAGVSSDPVSVTVKRDATAPNVVFTPASIAAEATSAAGAAVTFSPATATDATSGLASAVSCTQSSGATFPIATTIVSCSASDQAGNTGSANLSITVADTTPPAIDAHGNQTADATSAAGTLVNYLLPATHDAVDGNGTASCSPISGSVFPIGVNTVTCSATDAHGNHAVNTTFTVTVVDTPPVIDAHGNESAVATSASGAPVSYLLPVAHDVVDGTVPVSCTPASGSTFPIGTSTVTCSATDAHGNHAVNTTFTVTVTNNLPTFTPPANITAEATSPAGAVATFVAEGHDVESGTLTAACTPASGSTFPLGTTTVNCTVTDGVGATASGMFTVTVTDHTAPVLHLSADIVMHATSPSGAIVFYPAATATDIVDLTVPVSCSPLSGGSFPIGITVVHCSATDHAGNTATGSFNVTVSNRPPVCAAVPSISEIATSNHQLVPITINGVTDADGDAVAISVTGVFQDESTNTQGDGNTPVDGGGLGTSTALVRAERSGQGNGRVYHIQFTGTDAAGASCSGQVLVGVPHDQGNTHTLIDDGIKYNSVTGAIVP